MYVIVHPGVTVLCPADAILNARTCRGNAYFYHYKGSNVKYDFLAHGGPIYLPIKYRNFAQSPFNAYKGGGRRGRVGGEDQHLYRLFSFADHGTIADLNPEEMEKLADILETCIKCLSVEPPQSQAGRVAKKAKVYLEILQGLNVKET